MVLSKMKKQAKERFGVRSAVSGTAHDTKWDDIVRDLWTYAPLGLALGPPVGTSVVLNIIKKQVKRTVRSQISHRHRGKWPEMG